MTSTLEQLRTSHAEGVIVVAPVRQVVDAVTGIDPGVPLVVVGGDPEMDVATVTIDQQMGARLATQHLIELGHPTVHHVRGPKDWFDADARVRGWSEALRSSRAPRRREIIGDWGARSGYAAGQRLAREGGVTAVFAANDQMALGIVRALHDGGREVPADVSVVGFDDTPESAYFMPPSRPSARTSARSGGAACNSCCRSSTTALSSDMSSLRPSWSDARARHPLQKPDSKLEAHLQRISPSTSSSAPRLAHDDHGAPAATPARPCPVNAGPGQTPPGPWWMTRRMAESHGVVTGVARCHALARPCRASPCRPARPARRRCVHAPRRRTTSPHGPDTSHPDRTEVTSSPWSPQRSRNVDPSSSSGRHSTAARRQLAHPGPRATGGVLDHPLAHEGGRSRPPVGLALHVVSDACRPTHDLERVAARRQPVRRKPAGTGSGALRPALPWPPPPDP